MKGRSLQGKPIITVDRGEQIYRVDDVIFEPITGEILALLAESGSLFSQAKVVPFSEIQAIGEDAITVKSKDSVIPAESNERTKKYMQEDHKIKGKRILTEDGDELGKIVDFNFDERTGRISDYILSGGALVTVYQGRASLPLSYIQKIGEDVVFVSPDVKQRIQEEAGGLKGAARAVSEKASQTGEQLKSGARQIGQQTGSALNRTQERVKTYAHEFQESAPLARSQVTDLWGGVRDRFAEWTGQTRDKVQERKIKNALGRPVDRVIFDENDEVILDTGDLITHEAIDRAEQAGMLDVLLGSIYVQEPDLTTEDLKARKDE